MSTERGKCAQFHEAYLRRCKEHRFDELGEFVSNAATSASAFEHGIINYTRNVLDLDVQFLEYVREDICNGYDAFLRVRDVLKMYPNKEKQVSF